MKIQNISFTNNLNLNNKYNNSQQNIKNNNTSFSSRYSSEKDIITLIPDFENAFEKAAQKFGFWDKNPKPQPFVESLTEAGNKLRTFFQKDGKTTSYTIELTPDDKKIKSIFYDLDGITELKVTKYDTNENPIKL